MNYISEAQIAFCLGTAFGAISVMLLAAFDTYQKSKVPITIKTMTKLEWQRDYRYTIFKTITSQELMNDLAKKVGEPVRVPHWLVSPGSYTIDLRLIAQFSKDND